MNFILETDNFRIIEEEDTELNIDDLKGDTYTAKYHPEIDPKKIRTEELAFEAKVEKEGVYGYVLEQQEVKGTWVHRDSCWGFVGKYSGTNQHYIIDEMKGLAQATFAQFDFNSDRELLTDEDKDQIYELLAKGLRADNRSLLYRRIFEHYNMIPFHGILGRIIKESRKDGTTYWSYCASQSHTDEIRTVRKIILTCR